MAGKVRNIVVEELVRTPVEMQKVELVERKGIGHPDSIADGIAEAVSRALSREYVKRYGIILHHNTDQVEVVGGRAYPQFGGGEVIKPIYILLSGRAVEMVDREFFPVHEIALKAAKDYLRKAVRHLDLEHHVIIDSRIGQGSVDLVGVFNKAKRTQSRSPTTPPLVSATPRSARPRRSSLRPRSTSTATSSRRSTPPSVRTSRLWVSGRETR